MITARPRRNRVTEITGIDYLVFRRLWVGASARLASAVSTAGGMCNALSMADALAMAADIVHDTVNEFDEAVKGLGSRYKD